MLDSMYAVVNDPAFYSGIVVGACMLAAIIRIGAFLNASRGWRYVKGPING